MMVILMKASATAFYHIFMLHEGDALTEGKPRKTEGTRKQLRKDLATFQNTVVTEGYTEGCTEGFTEALFKCY